MTKVVMEGQNRSALADEVTRVEPEGDLGLCNMPIGEEHAR
jgi:hypothetical protein